MDFLHSDEAPPLERDTYPVAVVYDKMTSQIELQILRDLMALSEKWPVMLHDEKDQMSPEMLNLANIDVSSDPPMLVIVYKDGDEWPDIPEPYAVLPVIKRDLKPEELRTALDPNPKAGYYLREQGRDGANLTEMYLNRQHPRGNGVSDALIVLLWGN